MRLAAQPAAILKAKEDRVRRVCPSAHQRDTSGSRNADECGGECEPDFPRANKTSDESRIKLSALEQVLADRIARAWLWLLFGRGRRQP